MSFWRFLRCDVCAAKEAEIRRLTDLLEASLDRSERQAGALLRMARETAHVPPTALIPGVEGSAMDPLGPTVDLFLDAKFVHGTPLWRQQRREAVKLHHEGVESDQIVETLARGQRVTF